MTQDEVNRQAFQDEARELLAELETSLLELEETPEDQPLIDRIFRALHTIKGSGAMFGFDDIAGFTHDVENVFDLVRGGKMVVGRELLDLALASRDHIEYLLACEMGGEEPDLTRSKGITAGLKKLVPNQGEVEKKETDQPKAALTSPVTYRVRFRPEPGIFMTGTNPLHMLDELQEMGKTYIFPRLEDIPELDALDPEACHVWWDVILHSNATVEDIRGVFLFVEDDCDLLVQVVDWEGQLEGEVSHKRLGEILVERGDLAPEDLQRILAEKKPLGEILADKGMVSRDAVESALEEQKAVRAIQEARSRTVKTEVASSIRVAADKLDKLVDLVGELVIVQAQISQVVNENRDPTMTVLAEELERLSDELRDSTLGIRMLPFGTTFSRFKRLVRDLSAELGKEIDLETSGAETELDKTVIERLNDPLVHLLRNSIDHGVEPPGVRKAAGKPPRGVIRLSAEHSGGEVVITIIDDGAGIDPEKVRARAVERGLISPDAELSDKESYGLLFMPGFSTAETVTNVSGRGVGMDVVKRGIEALRGSIEMDSELGRGTNIVVKLPLTLAIIEGLQVNVGDEYFVIPLSLVEECVELSLTEDQLRKEQKIVNLRGEMVPYVRLKDCFQVPGQRPNIEQVVVVGVQAGRVGIVVDKVIGEHQTVIKSLGRIYRDVEGISGATIKGDGTMALILDVPRLIQAAEQGIL